MPSVTPCIHEINEYKQNRKTSSAKISATTNFLFSFSSLHALNKDIFHAIMQRQQQKNPHGITRERGACAESENCESLLFPIADKPFDTKYKCPTRRASFWVKFPTVRSLTWVKCPGIARGHGRFWNWLVHYATGWLVDSGRQNDEKM